MYAEVVGVYRDIRDGYLRNSNPSSIQDVTRPAFNATVSRVTVKLEIMCGKADQSTSTKDSEGLGSTVKAPEPSKGSIVSGILADCARTNMSSSNPRRAAKGELSQTVRRNR